MAGLLIILTGTGIYNLQITLLAYIDLKYGDKPARTFDIERHFKKTNRGNVVVFKLVFLQFTSMGLVCSEFRVTDKLFYFFKVTVSFFSPGIESGFNYNDECLSYIYSFT